MSSDAAARSGLAVEIRDIHKAFTLHHRFGGSIKRALLNVLRPRRVEVREVLKGITLEIAHGETVALVGRNGSGKSTLLSLVARVYRPTSGSVKVHGSIAPLLELGAGFHPDLTGTENIELYAAILGMKRATIREKMESIVQFAFDAEDLREKLDTPLRNYSEGMKARLGFAIAVHTDPDVLIVDEVLAVGDEAFQRRCYDRIHEFQRAGKTIVFVSHDMHVVRRVATRIVWLAHGRVYMDGPVDEVADAYVAAAERGELTD